MLDMSKAFDTIQRGALYENLHLLRLLLNDADIAVKFEKHIGELMKS